MSKLYRPNSICIALVAIVFGIIIGCTTTPKIQTPRPWMRILQSDREIIPNTKVKIDIIGQSQPLLGNWTLIDNEIERKLIDLLVRRGYSISDDSATYNMSFVYKTEKVTEFKMESSVQVHSGTKSGLGVNIARAVAISGVKSTQSVKNTASFNHTVSAEIYDKDKQLIWKGETIWNSLDPDILTNFTPNLRLLLSNLPSDTTLIPSIPEIKSTRAVNYFKMEMENKPLSCPALPYSINFGSAERVDWNHTGSAMPNGSIRYEDINALSAFLDLAETAEYALPIGNYNWEDLLNASLWSKVVLGAEYKFNNSDRRIKILMNLNGHTNGYTVDKCWVATDSEYSDFLLKLAVWKKALIQYYDVYK